MRRFRGYTLIEIMFGAAIFTIIFGAFYNFFAWTFPQVSQQLAEVYCWQDVKGMGARLQGEMGDVTKILAPTPDGGPSDFLAVMKADGNVYCYMVDPRKNLWKKQITGNLPSEKLYGGDWPYHIIAKPDPSEKWTEPEITMGQFWPVNDRHTNLYISLSPVVHSRLILNDPVQVLIPLAIP